MTAKALANTPTDTESRLPTTPFSAPWLSSLRRGLGRIGNRPVLMQGFSMTRAQATEISRQRSILARAITSAPGERQAIGVEIAKLLAAFPTQDPGVTAALRIEAYSDALGTAPAWAVREARLSIVRGEARLSDGPLDKRFAPTPPQLAEIVAGVVKPFRDDLADLVQLEQASREPEPDEAERARVAAGMAALKDEIRPPRNTRADALAGLSAGAASVGVDFAAAMDAIPDAPKRGAAE